MSGSFYVYVHLRADSKIPFYVGKGKGKRAWNTQGRNPYWKRIAKKHGFITEILHDSLSEDEAFIRETEEISWFKSHYDLVNLTDGGEGSSNLEQVNQHKSDIIDFISINGRFPRSSGEEKTLRVWLSNYCSPSRAMYDESFAGKLRQMGYGRAAAHRRVEEKKKAVLDFFKCCGRLPRKSVPEEYSLYKSMSRYCDEGNRDFDSQFSALIRRLGFGKQAIQTGKKEKQDEILQFVAENGRFPSKTIPSERPLAVRLGTYCSPSASAFDPDFRAVCVSLGYGCYRRLKKTSP